jgi:hypothetical protein
MGGQSMRLSRCIPALRFYIIVLAFSLVAAFNATAATKAVKFGKLWDGHSAIVNAVVIVENDNTAPAAEARRGDGFSVTGKRNKDAGSGRDYGARFDGLRRCRHRHA